MKNHALSRKIRKRIFRPAGFVLILAATWICIPAYASGELQLANDPAGAQLKTSYVCMMNNKYFGTEQIPVPVNGKTYYGCCQGCVTGLQNNPSLRYAFDPYTGRQVDKADAYIVRNPKTAAQVLYFESEKTFKQYRDVVYSQPMSHTGNDKT